VQEADVAVVGAGPGGLAAALELARAGADVVVVDEQPRAGGQIYRQPPATFAVSRRTHGAGSAAGKRLLTEFAAADGVRRLQETTVWGAFDVDAEGITLALAAPGGIDRLRARRLVVATGAYDLPVAFPGWTLPGVMSAGGVQAFAKSQQILAGRRFVLAGAHPLLLVVADQLLAAGGDVAVVALAQPRPVPREALLDLGRLRGNWSRLGDLAGPLSRLRRNRVPIRFSTLPIAAEGDGAVERVRLARVDDRWNAVDPATAVDCDTLVIGFGFVPSSELARQAGCTATWNDAAGGWVIEHDEWMRTSIDVVHVAGEVTGVAGAEQAVDEGRLAALGALRGLGMLSSAEAEQRAAPVRRRLLRLRRFSGIVQQRFALRDEALTALPDAGTVICRCEDVRREELDAALAENAHLTTLDAVKLLTRVGMGPCQGRMCQPSVTRIVAAATGLAPAALGPYRARPPLKPVSLAALAAADEDV
jgi:NADPH-dependent 2,4-dienoyl-CoA reductase/sulfur reductase-like enzyme